MWEVTKQWTHSQSELIKASCCVVWFSSRNLSASLQRTQVKEEQMKLRQTRKEGPAMQRFSMKSEQLWCFPGCSFQNIGRLVKRRKGCRFNPWSAYYTSRWPWARCWILNAYSCVFGVDYCYSVLTDVFTDVRFRCSERSKMRRRIFHWGVFMEISSKLSTLSFYSVVFEVKCPRWSELHQIISPVLLQLEWKSK